MSFTRPFTTLRKLTFQIADCRVDYTNNEGHLNFVMEPYTPVPSFTSTTSNPVLSAQPQSTSTLEDAPPSPSSSKSNTSTHSPSPPEIDTEQFLTPLQKEIETVTPIQQEEESFTTHGSIKDSQEEQSSTRYDGTKQDSQEENSSTDVSNFEISNFVKSEKFQKRIKNIKTTVTDKTFNAIAESPQAMKECLLQILNRFPDILDDNDGKEVLQYIDTNIGPVQINQSPNCIPDPEFDITHQDNNSQEKETLDKDENPEDSGTLDQDNENQKEQDNCPKIESRRHEDGDNIHLVEDSDSDCFIQNSPCPLSKGSPENLHDSEISEITPEPTSTSDSIQAPPIDKAPPTGTLEPITSTSGSSTLDVSPRVQIKRMPYLLHNIPLYDKNHCEIIVKQFLSRKRHTTDTDSQNITKPEKDRKHKKHKGDRQK